jgi:hypothetical protein
MKIEEKDIETARLVLKDELVLLKKQVADGLVLRPSERKYLVNIVERAAANEPELTGEDLQKQILAMLPVKGSSKPV